MIAVVFDMDGILFDTEQLCIDAWNHVAEAKGMEQMNEVMLRCIGLSGKDAKSLVLEHYGESFPFQDFNKGAASWIQEQMEQTGIPLKKGAKEILTFLKNKKAVLGLASSSKYSTITRNLKYADMEQYFSVIVSGDMVTHSKPQPEIYQLACRKMKVAPETTYAIEDSYNGIRAAYAAGMKPIMVPDLIEPNEEMKKMTVGIYRDLLEVISFFK